MTSNTKIDKLFLLILLILVSSINVFASETIPVKDTIIYIPPYSKHIQVDIEYFKIGKNIVRNPLFKNSKQQNAERGVAIALTILTGPLGGHRIYLGTQPVVPVVYAVTFGGIGTLPIIDLIHLIVVKDISRFENNDKIFMWIQDKE